MTVRVVDGDRARYRAAQPVVSSPWPAELVGDDAVLARGEKILGLPAASFIAIRWSSDATRTSTPKSVVSTPLARSASYFGAPAASPRMSKGPNLVSNVKFEPFAIDTASSTKGTSVGAHLELRSELLECSGEAFDVLPRSGVRDVCVVGRIPRPVSESGEAADDHEVDTVLLEHREDGARIELSVGHVPRRRSW